jgi:2-polyprenyl-3-methyl-5-hydroxy-6-metoxy-1,4-benzoquinol methylase/tetratricopeptide (TPR) repeat protein
MQQTAPQHNPQLTPTLLVSPTFCMPEPVFLDTVDTDPEILDDLGGFLIRSVVTCLQHKNIAAAIDAVRAHLKDRPAHIPTLNLLGSLMLKMGQLKEAEKILRQAASIAKDEPKVINNLAGVYLKLQQPDRALYVLDDLLRRHDVRLATFHYTRALALFNLERIAECILALNRSIDLEPSSEAIALLMRIYLTNMDFDQVITEGTAALQKFPEAHLIKFYLALAHYKLDHIELAVALMAQALTDQPDCYDYALAFGMISRYTAFSGTSQLYLQTLMIALNNLGSNTAYLSHIWCSYIRFLPGWSDLYSQAENLSKLDILANKIESLQQSHMLDTPLVTTGLRRMILRHESTEYVMTAVRKHFLEKIVHHPEQITDADRNLIAALACQCHYNEYVYCIDETEKNLIDDLCQKLSSEKMPNDSLLILSTYRPITDLINEEAIQTLKVHPLWSQLINEQILSVRREMDIMKTIPQLTPIKDDVSRAVEQMYLENPYPTWVSQGIRSNRAYLKLKSRKKDRHPVLIAGCGTGQHSLQTALSHENVQVTAIDLSKRSLAYAIRKTEEYKIDNIDYAQADILELRSIGRKFDMIECAGVLHHLKDPAAGLKVLVDLLNPNANMMLALYSERARAAIVTSRRHIAEKNYPTTIEGIRAFRHDVMSQPKDHPLRDITTSGDFYSTSTCRDLVFHIQETRYTPLQIKALLDDHGLEFLFFSLGPLVMNEFQKMFPKPEDAADLACWDEFEVRFPKTFAGMMQFYVRKRP